MHERFSVWHLLAELFPHIIWGVSLYSEETVNPLEFFNTQGNLRR
jgi:hypothetical protein